VGARAGVLEATESPPCKFPHLPEQFNLGAIALDDWFLTLLTSTLFLSFPLANFIWVECA